MLIGLISFKFDNSQIILIFTPEISKFAPVCIVFSIFFTFLKLVGTGIPYLLHSLTQACTSYNDDLLKQDVAFRSHNSVVLRLSMLCSLCGAMVCLSVL